MSKEKISFKQRVDLGKESSMIIWFPKIQQLPIPQIRTEIVKIGHKILYNWMAKQESIPTDVWVRINNAMNAISNYPMFMRTDQSSAKHEWKNTCFVESSERLQHNLSHLIENHEMNNMAGELGYEALVFREFLELESYFTTDFYGDFPVNKEVRCFIDKGRLVSIHNYWFEDAVKQGHPHDPKWRSKLKKLNALEITDLSEIKTQLHHVCQVFKENWSVDFAKGKNGTWYLTDMARGEVSYHPEDVIEEYRNES